MRHLPAPYARYVKVIFNTPDPLLAQAARDHLIAHGILAAAVPRVEGWAAAVRSHDVILCFGAHAEIARELLAGDDWRPRAMDDDDWEHDDALPDLSLLDAGLAPGCPGCGESLPLDAALEACPVCGTHVDVAELVAQAHGPEALDQCYDEPESMLDPAAIEELRLLCPRCQYPLDGLPNASNCPECGQAFNKDQMVRDFLGWRQE